jgi:hypothetical protein
MGMFDRFKKKSAALQPAEIIVPRAVEPRPSSAAPSGYESPYLPSELAEELLVAGPGGMPPLHFREHAGAWWLAEDTTGKLVNVATRRLRGLGIWSCRVRGDTYADGQLRLGVVELVREPDNQYDRHAVAIWQDGAQVGYFNKGLAAGLAKALDAGVELTAIGTSIDPPKVVAAAPEIIEHLVRRMR